MRVADEKRRALLRSEADRIAGGLVKVGATLVVAFGSFARGRPGMGSDLDILVVMESELPFVKRIEQLCTDLLPRVGLYLLVYTPAEFERMKDSPFVRRALSEGRILHAA